MTDRHSVAATTVLLDLASLGHERSADRDAGVAEDVVDVLALAWLDAADDERARQEELAAGELSTPISAHDDAVRGHDPAADLLAGLRIDHGNAGVEHRCLAEDGAVAHARPLRDHAATADHAVVADHHRAGVGGLEHATDADAAGEVGVRTDLRAGGHRGPCVDHRVGADAGA